MRSRRRPRQGTEGNPRTPAGPRQGVRRLRPRSEFREMMVRDTVKATGAIAMIESAPRGGKPGVVFGPGGPNGGISVDPGVADAYRLRKSLTPLRVVPCIITGADGRPIARIEVDPVTGARRRVALPA